MDQSRQTELVDEEGTSLSDILGHTTRPGWKPKVDQLKDAIVDGVFLLKEGDAVLVQFPQEHRDTTLFAITFINHETGKLILWNLDKMQHTSLNFKGCPPLGFEFKIPDASRKWSASASGDSMADAVNRRRRRMSGGEDDPQEPTEKTPAPVPLDAEGNPIKRKRGRPKGSKNKSKETPQPE